MFSILVAQLLHIGWNAVYLILFQGVYLGENLSNLGYSGSEIAEMTGFMNDVSLSLGGVSSFLLIAGLIIIGKSLTRALGSKQSHNL